MLVALVGVAVLLRRLRVLSGLLHAGSSRVRSWRGLRPYFGLTDILVARRLVPDGRRRRSFERLHPR